MIRAIPQPEFRDPGLQADFDREGWVVHPALGPAEVEALHSLWAEVGPEHEGSFSVTTGRVASIPTRRRVSDVVTGCLQPVADRLVRGYRVLSGCFLVKRASGAAVPLHRHPAVLDETRHAALVLWLPLQPTPPEAGCMIAVPGTHRVRSLAGRVVAEGMEDLDVRAVPLKTGEAMVWDHRLLHGSLPNLGGRDRLAVGALLAPRDVPLWFCRISGSFLEVFEVPDDFYVRSVQGEEPPVEGPPLFRFPQL